MLLLDSTTHEIEGVMVFPDHADPLVRYYLPAMPHLSTNVDAVTGAEVPSFLLLGYVGTEEQGTGGFLSFDVNLGIAESVLADVAARIRAEDNLPQDPRLVPVPLVGGTVRLQMLGTGTGDQPTPVVDGQPQSVLGIDQPTQPSLYGMNQASFSVRLDQPQFTVIDDCIDGAILPVVVRYQLDYLALRPAYHVSLAIDWDRVQDHLDETFGADVLFFSSQISDVVDELVEERAIDFGSDSFIEESEANEAIIARRDAAVAQVRQMITDAFFTPSIPPWTPEAKEDWVEALDAVGGFLSDLGAGPASQLTFSYNKTHYTRIDRKSLNVNFSERTTVRRPIFPQAHLAQVLSLITESGRPREDFVRIVNIDDPRFARRRLKVKYMPGLAVDEIAAIDIRANYAGQVKNEIVNKESDWSGDFEWLNVMAGDARVDEVVVSYEVLFAGVDTTERPSRLQGPSVTTSVEEIIVSPEEDVFAIVPVTVRTENMDWEEYSSVSVDLRYVDEENRIRQTDTFRLTSDAEVIWHMFVMNRQLRTFEARWTLFSKDSRTHTFDWRMVDDEQVTITDPFPPLEVDLVPPHVWTQISRVFVDVRYVDEGNDFRHEESFTLENGAEVQTFRVKLRNRQLRTVFYTVTFQMVDGRTVRVPESMTNERRIAITPDMKARRLVTVHRPVDFIERNIEKVTVNLRFEDFLGGLSFADTVVFDAATETGSFEYQILDGSRDSYEYEVNYVMANGMLMSQPWTATDAEELTPVTP